MTVKEVQALLMPEIRRLGEKICRIVSPEAVVVKVESINSSQLEVRELSSRTHQRQI